MSRVNCDPKAVYLMASLGPFEGKNWDFSFFLVTKYLSFEKCSEKHNVKKSLHVKVSFTNVSLESGNWNLGCCSERLLHYPNRRAAVQRSRESECSDPSALFRIRFHANHKNKRTLIQRCIQGGEGLTVSGEQPAEVKRASHVPLLITAVAV